MLHVDLTAGRYEIVQSVTRKCALFGEVKNISIFLESTATAMVEMSTFEQTEMLAARFDGKLVRSAAIIELTPRPDLVLHKEAA